MVEEWTNQNHIHLEKNKLELDNNSLGGRLALISCEKCSFNIKCNDSGGWGGLLSYPSFIWLQDTSASCTNCPGQTTILWVMVIFRWRALIPPKWKQWADMAVVYMKVWKVSVLKYSKGTKPFTFTTSTSLPIELLEHPTQTWIFPLWRVLVCCE